MFSHNFAFIYNRLFQLLVKICSGRQRKCVGAPACGCLTLANLPLEVSTRPQISRFTACLYSVVAFKVTSGSGSLLTCCPLPDAGIMTVSSCVRSVLLLLCSDVIEIDLKNGEWVFLNVSKPYNFGKLSIPKCLGFFSL